MAKDKKGCGREEHFTFTFIGFGIGAALVLILAVWARSRDEDKAVAKEAKRVECDALDQKARKYSSLYTHLFYPSQKHTHDELKDALAEILTSKFREIDARREQLNCGYAE